MEAQGLLGPCSDAGDPPQLPWDILSYLDLLCGVGEGQRVDATGGES